MRNERDFSEGKEPSKDLICLFFFFFLFIVFYEKFFFSALFSFVSSFSQNATEKKRARPLKKKKLWAS